MHQPSAQEHQVRANLCLEVPLKTAKDIEDCKEQLVQTIQQVAWNSTPHTKQTYSEGRMHTSD